MSEIPPEYESEVRDTLQSYLSTYEELTVDRIPNGPPNGTTMENYVLRATLLTLADCGFIIPSADFYMILNTNYQKSDHLMNKLYGLGFETVMYSNSSYCIKFPGNSCNLFVINDAITPVYDSNVNVILTDIVIYKSKNAIPEDKLITPLKPEDEPNVNIRVFPILGQKVNKAISPSLLTVKQKQIEMCQLRNYSPIGPAINNLPLVEESYLHDDLFAFNLRLQIRQALPHSMFDLKDIRYSLFTSHYCHNNTQIFIFYTSEIVDTSKFLKGERTELSFRLLETKIKGSTQFNIFDHVFPQYSKMKIIYITNGKIDATTKKDLNDVANTQMIEERALKNFLFDSVLSPSYEILSPVERAEFYASWKLKRDEMPPFIASDPAATLLDLSANTIVRITRDMTMPLDKIQPLVPVEVTYRST